MPTDLEKNPAAEHLGKRTAKNADGPGLFREKEQEQYTPRSIAQATAEILADFMKKLTINQDVDLPLSRPTEIVELQKWLLKRFVNTHNKLTDG